MERYSTVPSQHEPNEAIAAIDIGTNSAHLVIARVLPGGSLKILDSEKSPLRLGDYLDKTNRLSKDAILRTINTMSHFQQISSSYTKWIRAVATHATREAINHEELLSGIKDATGIEVEIIDGLEEARLGFLGMRNGLHLDQELCLGCDIGGGSTELTIAKGDDIRFVTSLKLGAVVFTQKYFENTTPTKEKIEELRRHIQARLIPISRDILSHKHSKAVIASGTAKAMAVVHAKMFGKGPLTEPNAYVIPSGELLVVARQLVKLQTAEKIRESFDLDQNRAEIIIAGALILESITTVFEIPSWQISTFSLREGLVADTYSRAYGTNHNLDTDVRWRSVADFGRKFLVETTYVHHVCELSAQIYNQLSAALCSESDEEELNSNPDILHAAAYLHEVGKLISYSQHHKHSFYILSQASILGFTQREKLLIALIVRYHRKASPEREDEAFKGLFGSYFKRVQILSGVLRLATALERTRRGTVRSIKFKISRDEITMSAEGVSGKEPEVELTMAHRERKTLSKCFGRKFRLETKLDLAP